MQTVLKEARGGEIYLFYRGAKVRIGFRDLLDDCKLLGCLTMYPSLKSFRGDDGGHSVFSNCFLLTRAMDLACIDYGSLLLPDLRKIRGWDLRLELGGR